MHGPHFPANPGELPQDFRLFTEQRGDSSCCCHPLGSFPWQNHMLFKKRKRSSPAPFPKETRTYTCFSKTLIPGFYKGPGEISHQRVQDDDDFQHDQNRNGRNGCSAIQKLSHCLGWSLPLLPVILLILL